MAGRSLKADNRGNDFFGFLASGKGRQYHTARDAIATAPVSGMTATGGVITDYTSGSDVYRAHVFTSSGTFTVSDLGDLGTTVEYLVVAGGGGAGGGGQSGGGGAGGLRTNLPGVVDASPSPLTISTPFPVTAGPTSYVVTVGAGGAGSSGPSNLPGSKGVDSYFGPPSAPNGTTATGGGYGGGLSPQAAGPGGSGGGSGNGPGTQNGGSGNAGGNIDSKPEGNDGGGAPGYSSQYYGGGGGGAGAAGTPGPGSGGAPGGIGVQVAIAGPPTASPVGTPGPSGNGWFAGGGGAGGNTSYQSPSATSAGGAGGGGTGSASGEGTSGTFATGGGGGAGAYPGNHGSSGGSGIVVVRYLISSGQSGSAKASGGSISFYGGKTIHTFTSTGTFTAPGSFSETLEYVIIGGGGAGGGRDYRGGGGGAGAVRHGTTPVSGPSSTAVQVGAGGAWSAPTAEGPSGNGTSSYFGTPITSPGGGMGAGYASPYAGITGGSGGGAGGYPGGSAGLAGTDPGPATGAPFPGDPADASPTNGWGYRGGGRGDDGLQQGGGGGGAGGQGIPSNRTDYPTTYGLGGPGIQLPATFRNPAGSLGTPGPNPGGYYVAGGGNGGGYSKHPNPASSGVNMSVATTKPVGGGGYGAIDGPGNAPEPTYPVYRNGQPGNENTGSGGGGTSPQYAQGSGRGGSGIVLIAYPS